MHEDRHPVRAGEMTPWRWSTRREIETVHERQLSEHGGGTGTRDDNMLESALARPLNPANYGDPDAAALAASLADGLARNHPFVDGNKRSAWVAARLFLRLNQIVISFDKAEAAIVMQRLAAGELGEDELAAWLRDRIVAVSPPPGA